MITSNYNRYFKWDCGCYWPVTERDATGEQLHCPTHDPQHYNIVYVDPVIGQPRILDPNA